MSTEEKQEEAGGATLDRGTYEILRDRLEGHAKVLRERANELNARRLELFGGAEMTVAGNERIRTENNCVPRDIRPVGAHLLFGYNVFIGLKTETRVEDVLSLRSFEPTETGFEFEPVPLGAPENFLSDERFQDDFKELYRYYKDTRLQQLRRVEDKLLAVFQTGASISDIKVFRWVVSPQGEVTYVDNRGERDHVFPPSHDFEWIATRRENFVLGRHPHVSILDEVFVETVGGDLTVKVEDNTEDGRGIYGEPVDEPNQSLDDAEIHYAKLGTLILLKILPYNETAWRYFVFNTRTQAVERIDAIGQSCIQLPEDHGLIFPGGYYLQGGETKIFDADVDDMEFLRAVRSPNGEDVLYVFHKRREGQSILLTYNLIRKEVQTPIEAHGFSLFDDGRLVVSRMLSDEPTRVHPMQIWQTPFVSEEVAAQAPSQGTFLEKVGNADLVRGISDALSLCRHIQEQTPSVAIYEDLISAAQRALDAYYWLDREEVGGLREPFENVRQTADLIVGEFQKVESIKKRAREAVAEAEKDLEEVFGGLRPEFWEEIDPFVQGLAELRRQRGHLVSLRELRYVDLEKVGELETRVAEEFDKLSDHTVEFLLRPEALDPYRHEIEELAENAQEVEKVADGVPIRERIEELSDGLELLTEIVTGLEIDDATERTRILEAISEVIASLNRARAIAEARRKELMASEGRAEFGVQFKLFSQNVSGALALADTPEKCDQQLSKLLLQLEDLESRFGEFDEFVEPLARKREEVYDALSSRKQTLLDQRQRRAQRLMDAAERILEGVARRSRTFEEADELNAFFVGDAMVAKVRDISSELRELGSSVHADELDSRLKSTREDAARGLRDRQDLYEEGAEVIRLGRHRFSVNTQEFDLTLVPRGEDADLRMAFHLSGTDFFETVRDEGFEATREYWPQLIVSETGQVYRGEYLAYSLLRRAEEGGGSLDLEKLHEIALEEGSLVEHVRRYAAERYDEGYERGLHDHDGALILRALLGLYTAAGLLRFASRPRAWAALFWAFYPEQMRRALWVRRARSLARLRTAFAHSPEIAEFTAELAGAIEAFCAETGLDVHPDDARVAGVYLFEELARHPQQFVKSSEAVRLLDAFRRHLEENGAQRDFEEDLRELQDDLRTSHRLAAAWLQAFLGESDQESVRELEPALPEAVVALLTERQLNRVESNALGHTEVEGLLGQHPRVRDRELELRLDEFLLRLSTFHQRRVPGFRAYQELRHDLLESEREELRLGEYRPRVMSAFVRNRLIDEVYLPLIGDNLAKQLGALGEGKRTDQMGLLLLISPPGYGKTTLMEYVANRLGLVFVKVNGPALGHAVTSLDPAEAKNATARQEVDKINFALEMGNNVLLYLDDIQHTHPELLQKFISMCDAQRRMEGVWHGKTRTYDLRGKRFAVCMAGNPYTEAGERFQIPDMLANRADTYNLGEVLEGRDELFAISYIENSLTSNPTLAPLATREREDLHKLVRMAQGEEIPPDQLEGNYSSVELEEMLSVLKKLLHVQSVVLKVNRQYILSASQEEAYRTEPRFQLQGSYRNMNKLAEKIVPVMNEKELEALLDDHYLGESQTLTTGAEHNLLKLAELRGRMSEKQAERWGEIKRGFARQKHLGGSEEDPAVRVIRQLGLVGERLEDIGTTIRAAGERTREEGDGRGESAELAEALSGAFVPWAEKLQETVAALAQAAAERPAPPPTPAPPPSPPPEPKTPPAPAMDLGPYLEKLDETLGALAEAPRGGQIVQALPAGVYDLLTDMGEAVGEGLLPLVKDLSRRLDPGREQDRPMIRRVDRVLKNLDQLQGLVAALRSTDTRALAIDRAARERD